MGREPIVEVPLVGRDLQPPQLRRQLLRQQVLVVVRASHHRRAVVVVPLARLNPSQARLACELWQAIAQVCRSFGIARASLVQAQPSGKCFLLKLHADAGIGTHEYRTNAGRSAPDLGNH